MKKTLNIKKLILLNMPYILLGLFATNFGEAWRMAQGADASEKFLSLVAVLPGALQSFWPSLHPLDLLVGLCCGVGLRLAVYLKSKNAKKYRHGLEYGSARWGTREDIAPYVDPVFQNNVILTKTESLTMNSRPKDPKTARNKNVLVIGGSGSGKTRFWLKPNLMQMHSSYVVTDPKGTILVECGKMLQRGAPKPGKDGKPMKDKHGKVIYEPYRIKVLNTINFKKSMVRMTEMSDEAPECKGLKVPHSEMGVWVKAQAVRFSRNGCYETPWHVTGVSKLSGPEGTPKGMYAGVDPKTVQYLAGHENSKTTMDIYAKVKYNKPEELFGVVNGAFQQAIAE